ncbi:hypothetical protein, partial [Sulfuriflexus sp.]|uniref:hypothetical protein n=1 Tax=Sulfuriflexus sp. TaxID=2015443 RepID=UPI0028CE53B9
GKWVGRILQETRDPLFEPSRDGLFENNLVVTDDRLQMHFNIGRGTDPESFVFRGNAWFDPQGKIRPILPTYELDGIYNLDPGIVKNGEGQWIATSADPRVKNVGPWGYSPWVAPVAFGDIIMERSVTPVAVEPEPEQTSLPLVGGLAVLGLTGLVCLAYRALRPIRR